MKETLLLICCMLSGCLIQQQTVQNHRYYKVIKVVDGDTFWLANRSEKGLKVRLIGIDTPESRRTGKRDTGYYGQAAKNYLTSLILHKKIRLEYDAGRQDQYHRTLAYAYLQNGLFVNADLLKKGYAKAYTVPPNVKYADLFLKLERKAREKRCGLWRIEDK